MLGSTGHSWALPPSLPAPHGLRRRLPLLAGTVVAAAPVLLLRDDVTRAALVAAAVLALAGTSGLLAALALRVLRSVHEDATLGRAAVGFALVPVVTVLLAVTTDPDDAGDAALVLVQWTALAVALPAAGLALAACRPYRRQLRRWRLLETQVRALWASSPLLPGPSITPEDEEGLPTEAEVRALIGLGRVDIALQPVVALADGRVVGQEALARFGGRVPTDRWFRGAGYHGLSAPLELLALRAALALLPRVADDASLAVNLSPLALADDDVLAELRQAELSRVVIEITEHEAVRDYAAARAHLDELRAAGARIAVDDIGAGFASLRHALLLRPDVVKLDQSLTRGIEHDARQRGVVVALVRFAAEVGVELVAEGVETTEQAAALQALGLVHGQGWGLGVPVLQRDDDVVP